MIGFRNGQPIDKDRSLIATLKRIDGMIDGWGKHYWFCNDGHVLRNLDSQIAGRIGEFLGKYRALRSEIGNDKHARLLGISELSLIKREPFAYPSLKD